VADTVATFLGQDAFTKSYADVFAGDARWQGLSAPEGKTFAWDTNSTYVQEPPYFQGITMEPAPIAAMKAPAVWPCSATR
jgi:aconitate hydratase